MSKHRTARRHTALTVLVALLVAAALALLAAWAFLRGRVEALTAGAAFGFDYTVTSTAPEASLAWRTLDALGALSGSVTGQTHGDDVAVSLYTPGAEDASPYTELYVVDGQVYLNVRQLYRTFLSQLTAQYPAVAPLIPDWGLGEYVTQDQLALLLGAEPAVGEMQNYSVSVFDPRRMRRVQPEGAIEGYLYFTPEQDTGDAVLTVGFPLHSLWSDFFYCHVLVELPGQGLRFSLTGKALAGDYAIAAPASVMRDEDIAALADLFNAVRAIADFVRELAGAVR